MELREKFNVLFKSLSTDIFWAAILKTKMASWIANFQKETALEDKEKWK